MAGFLNNISAMVASTIGWMGDYATAIAENDLLLLFVVAIPVVGLGIGALKRMISV